MLLVGFVLAVLNLVFNGWLFVLPSGLLFFASNALSMTLSTTAVVWSILDLLASYRIGRSVRIAIYVTSWALATVIVVAVDPLDTRGAKGQMSNRNVPVTNGAANDQELTRLMAGLPGMVYRASTQSPFAFEIVGGGYERILGRSLDELTTKPDIRLTLMYPDDVARYRAVVENAVKCGNTFEIEYSVIYPDTTERVVWEQGGPVRAPDGSCFIEDAAAANQKRPRVRERPRENIRHERTCSGSARRRSS